MPFNPRSICRMSAFLDELASNNMVASHISRSTYRLRDHIVSIRTTTKPGPIYWYDISQSVMNEVEYLIYQMDSPKHFVTFPSSFFRRHYEELKDSNRPHAKQFYLNWRDKTIVSKPAFTAAIRQCCCSTERGDSYGNWRDIFVPT